jgi:hypothetical protein
VLPCLGNARCWLKSVHRWQPAQIEARGWSSPARRTLEPGGKNRESSLRRPFPSKDFPKTIMELSQDFFRKGRGMIDRRRHPSGRPIREPKIGVRSIWRVPDRGPIIPRLQPEEPRASAIGFTADICARDDDDDR